MRLTLIIFALLLCMQVSAQNNVKTGSYNPVDTSWFVGNMKVQQGVRFVGLPDPDSSKVLATDAKGNLYLKEVVMIIPSLSDVTGQGNITPDGIQTGGLIIKGFAYAPGGGEGGSRATILHRHYYDPNNEYELGAMDSVITQSIRSFQEYGYYTLVNNASMAVVDIRPHVIAADTDILMDHFIAIQEQPYFDDLNSNGTISTYYGYNPKPFLRGVSVGNMYNIKIDTIHIYSRPGEVGYRYGLVMDDYSTKGIVAGKSWGLFGKGLLKHFLSGGIYLGPDSTIRKSSVKLGVDGVTELDDTVRMGGEVYMTGIPAAATTDSILGRNADGKIVKIPKPSGATPTLQQVTTAGATTTATITTAGLISGAITGTSLSINTGFFIITYSGGALKIYSASTGFLVYDFNANGDISTRFGGYNGSNVNTFQFNGNAVDSWLNGGGGLAINAGSSASGHKLKVGGTANITGKLTIDNFLNMSTNFTPSGTADGSGSTNDITKDANYIYVKTAAGWKRAALSTF